MNRRTVKRLLFVLAALVAGGAVVVAGLAWYYLPLGPLFDDGPFHGVAVAPIDGRQPDQSLGIFGGYMLEVFDPAAAGESPVVQLRDGSGDVRWAVRADGHQPGDVRSIRFAWSRRGLARSGSVGGTVDWTYGREATYWFVTSSGELRDYWCSW